MITTFVKYLDRSRDYIIFDVGSRDCEQSIEFYHAFPNAHIYAFECNPNTLPLCKKNIAPFSDRITLVEGAVCDYDGSITFYPINQQKTRTTWKDGNPGASSIYKSNGKYQYEHYVQDEMTTNCHRLDTVMSNLQIPHCDIIWMDLQGAELLAMHGLGKQIEYVKYIHVEVSHKEMYEGQVLFSTFHTFMAQHQFIIANRPTFQGWQEDIIYKKGYDFDVVVPVCEKDLPTLQTQLMSIIKNVQHYRNIYVIASRVLLDTMDSIFFDTNSITKIDESIFPFSMETVSIEHGENPRNGWYLQQLLKLYAGQCIPDIMDTYLVIDADTFFLKPTTFYDNNKCLYNYGMEYHQPYFVHMKKLYPALTKQLYASGICHHMMFETKYISELFALIETNTGVKFYETFLREVLPENYLTSGASEYEIYFNYIVKFHNDKIHIRKLEWMNLPSLVTNGKLDYVSVHTYLQK